MALSRSLATLAFVGCLSVAAMAPAQQGDDNLSLLADPQPASLEQLAKEANELKDASQWKDFRAKVKDAERVHRELSDALAKQRKVLDQAQQDLDAALAKIERPQIMIQAILAEAADLDDEVLKAACMRVNAEAVKVSQDRGSWEPMIYSLSSGQAGRLLATIEKRRPLQVISRPSILTLDGQMAEVTIGEQVKRPVAARVSPKDRVKIEESVETVGLIVSLTPTIQGAREARLEMAIKNSALSGESAPIFVEADGQVVSSPIVDSRWTQTALQVTDGRTALVAIKSYVRADEPTKTTLVLLTPRILIDRTAAAGEILHH